MTIDSHGPPFNCTPRRRRNRRNWQQKTPNSPFYIHIPSLTNSPASAATHVSGSAIAARDESPSPRFSHLTNTESMRDGIWLPETEGASDYRPNIQNAEFIECICRNLVSPAKIDTVATAKALGYINHRSVNDRIGLLKKTKGVNFKCAPRKLCSNALPNPLSSNMLRRSPRKKEVQGHFESIEVEDDSNDENYEDTCNESEEEDEDELVITGHKNASKRPSPKKKPAAQTKPKQIEQTAIDDSESDGWTTSESLKELLEKARLRAAAAKKAMGIKRLKQM